MSSVRNGKAKTGRAAREPEKRREEKGTDSVTQDGGDAEIVVHSACIVGLMHPARHNSRRVFAAWLCLFAAICLYVPLTLSAWPVAMSCCDGNHCAIPAHHRGTSHSSSRGTEQGMPCEHGANGMSDCGMSCCEQQEHAAIAPVAYVLPVAIPLAAPVLQARRTFAAQPTEFLRSIEPLSPPPRA